MKKKYKFIGGEADGFEYEVDVSSKYVVADEILNLEKDDPSEPFSRYYGVRTHKYIKAWVEDVECFVYHGHQDTILQDVV